MFRERRAEGRDSWFRATAISESFVQTPRPLISSHGAFSVMLETFQRGTLPSAQSLKVTKTQLLDFEVTFSQKHDWKAVNIISQSYIFGITLADKASN
jgi:hypothetical protein